MGSNPNAIHREPWNKGKIVACGGVEAKRCERAATPGDQRHLGSQSTPS
jgi:hypothetical protein